MKELIQILGISIALAVDAMSVTFSYGIRPQSNSRKMALRMAIPFAFFQGLMATIGWGIGLALADVIERYGSVIGFILLTLIGVKTIIGGLTKDGDVDSGTPGFSKVLVLSIITSIDALVVGTTISIFSLPVTITIFAISSVTFILCLATFFLSTKVGKYFGERVEIVGGFVLIFVGISLLVY